MPPAAKGSTLVNRAAQAGGNLFDTDVDAPGSSVDWTLEYSKERLRNKLLNSRRGLRGRINRVWDIAQLWACLILIGGAVALVAAACDILTAWLSDLRYGVCSTAWYLSEKACCKGFEGSECFDYVTYRQLGAGVVSSALLSYSLYIGLSVGRSASRVVSRLILAEP